MLCGSLNGRGVWGRMDTCICMAELLCCAPETIPTLLIGCIQYKTKSFLKIPQSNWYWRFLRKCKFPKTAIMMQSLDPMILNSWKIIVGWFVYYFMYFEHLMNCGLKSGAPVTNEPNIQVSNNFWIWIILMCNYYFSWFWSC